ncbi:MAG TPA: hypothetical protein VFM96_15025 [Gaiellaceae bacterium]|nr:hypothetical protein [Gaiellaceae bacterium]
MLAYAVAREPAFAAAIAGIGGIGAVMLAFVLVGSEELLVWAIACLGGAYALSLVAHGSAIDPRAPLVALGLFACAELASWSLQERHARATPHAITGARAFAVAALALSGLAAAALVLAISAVPAGNGVAWTVLGAAAAVAILGVAARLAQRAR